jgi:hypothetical protein
MMPAVMKPDDCVKPQPAPPLVDDKRYHPVSSGLGSVQSKRHATRAIDGCCRECLGQGLDLFIFDADWRPLGQAAIANAANTSGKF